MQGLYLIDVYQISKKVIQQSRKKLEKKLKKNKLITMTTDITYTLYEHGTDELEVPGERVERALTSYPILKLTTENEQLTVSMHIVDVLINLFNRYHIRHIEYITFYIDE